MKDARIEKSAEILKAVAESLKDTAEKIDTVAALLSGIAQEQEAAEPEQGTLFNPSQTRRKGLAKFGRRRWDNGKEIILCQKNHSNGLSYAENAEALAAAGFPRRSAKAIENYIEYTRKQLQK